MGGGGGGGGGGGRLLLSADNLCKQLDPDQDKMSGLIWIQTVRHPDGIEKIQHPKSKIWHNNKV